MVPLSLIVPLFTVRKVTTWKERKKKEEREMNDENNGYLLYVDHSEACANLSV